MILLRCIRIQHEGHETPALIPSDQPSWDALKKKKVGSTIATETKRARSPQHHRKFWAVMNAVFENQQTKFPDVDSMVDAIKIEIGHADIQLRLSGESVLIPRSISFHDCDQDKFNEFYKKAIDCVCEFIIPGATPEEVNEY